MLNFISIDNFALIDRLELEFGPGLNLITGETGSGKSILVDALGLLLGGRASQEMIRQGYDAARIEGLFHLPEAHPARDLLAEAGIELSEEQLVIRREVSRTSMNKVFINGTLSSQSFLARLREMLAEIHGQHDQQLLLQPSVHREFLDAFGHHRELSNRVGELFRELQDVRGRIEELKTGEQERLQRLDLIRFQQAEIEKLGLAPGLDRELESERELLSSAEKRIEHARQSYQLLYEQEASALALLDRAGRHLESLSSLDPALQSAAERLREARFQLEDVAYQIRGYTDSVEFNPSRLETVEGQLAELQKARRKYGATVDDILAYADRIAREADELQAHDQRLEGLGRRQQELFDDFQEQASRLSSKRKEDAGTLCRRVEQELAQLAMERTLFQVQLDRSLEWASEQGIDRVEFLISANPGEDPRPLARIVSGGELSRVILALKSILTLESYAKTLVFDEVDAGIGGRVAAGLGEKLARLARRHQVFCVTHLPQIAAFADQHFSVRKASRRQRTVVTVERLDRPAREQELARMLAGEHITDTTRRQAREMLEQAARR